METVPNGKAVFRRASNVRSRSIMLNTARQPFQTAAQRSRRKCIICSRSMGLDRAREQLQTAMQWFWLEPSVCSWRMWLDKARERLQTAYVLKATNRQRPTERLTARSLSSGKQTCGASKFW
jgi:hypothetical protein